MKVRIVRGLLPLVPPPLQPLYIETERGGDKFLLFAAASVHLMSFRIVHAKIHSTSPLPPPPRSLLICCSCARASLDETKTAVTLLQISSSYFVVKHTKNCCMLMF